jgi:RNA 2',3'-cyclic 3'-phosphodiesterase
MRLFIAIQFTEEIKNQLCSSIERLKKDAVQGNFTLRENLHLTLVFIGETEKVKEVERAMDAVQMEPFLLNIGGFGKFNRDGGDIYWIGIEKDEKLLSIYKQLLSALTKAGFRLESREYNPHLTLGREVILKDGFDRSAFENAVPKMNMKVEKISLMKSERVNGKLTYTEIYCKRRAEG